MAEVSRFTNHESRSTDREAAPGPDLLLHLYREMLRIRRVEEEIARLYPEQEMRCPVHLCIGQEAVAVGVCAALRREDAVVSSHRAHGHYLAKGGDLKAMLAEIYGKSTGCAGGRGGSMHLVDRSVNFLASAPVVGGTVPVGVGAALGARMKGQNCVTVAFFGDACVEEGVVHESLNYAALKKLPVIFVCENNLYSTATPLSERQPDRPIYQWAKGYGMPACNGNGNDVEAVLTLAQDAAARAHEGGGPTFLELATYRWREHVGPNYDIDLGYRTADELAQWQEQCPVETFRQKLTERGILTAMDGEQILREIQKEIDDAFHYAKVSPFPIRAAMLEPIYAS